MGADTSAENTPKICLPKPKSFGFLKKKPSLWVSVVRGKIREIKRFLAICSCSFSETFCKGIAVDFQFRYL